uniref:CP2 domain-containing protein n=1 Tax=Steinernema glaseri TaxID=37863 RepID=A0A1I8AJU9_9BILA
MAMKFGNFDSAQSVITQPSTVATPQFAPLDSASVIKTAPPGSRQHEFVSPKQEPLETSLQDLGKMQPTAIDYYSMQNYGRVYSADQYLAAPQSLNLIQGGAGGQAALYYNTAALPGSFAAEWSAPRPMEYYPRATYQEERVYKAVVDMPSPVDSGIGADLSLLAANGAAAAAAAAKEDAFYGAAPQELVERPERTLSHRDSPVVIAKIHNRLGFQYVLEAPISTSIRRDDDRMTYVNKGQYYSVVLSYIPDHQKPLQSKTVRSCLMLAFREDKTYEKEMETWCKWHKEQQNRRQRIIDFDPKNSSGIIGTVSEPALNAIDFYWEPTEGPVKISVAVQCLSTDFSPQKGVKGWPMHLQIDTFDDENAKVPFHRGYCQIKVFCDKGANRKMLHENRRDEKRRQTVAGRKKTEGEFHEPCDKSEFYHMSDLDRPAALFHGNDHPFDQQFLASPVVDAFSGIAESLEPVAKRPRLSERVMLYAKRSEEMVFEALHVMPPSVSGLLGAVSSKFGIDPEKVGALYKRCRKGVTVKMDDEMIKHYCNEDTFQLELEPLAEDRSRFSVLLVELDTAATADYNPN